MAQEQTPTPGRAPDCPCIQTRCPLHGNCVECVAVHRKGAGHVPECMQDLLRQTVQKMAALVEYGVIDKRPDEEFWVRRAAQQSDDG
jgi:hypothetical protein